MLKVPWVGSYSFLRSSGVIGGLCVMTPIPFHFVSANTALKILLDLDLLKCSSLFTSNPVASCRKQ